MKLFLASEVKHPNSIEKIKEYIGGFENKSIAYIPTAANGERGWESWKSGGSWSLVQTLGAKINLILLEDYRNKSVVTEIKKNDILWIAGGAATYLMYWIVRCELDKYINEILNSKIIYVGSSAGSMIMGQTLQISAWTPDEECGAENFKPLKLVDFDIYPHFEDDQYEFIKNNYKGKKIYLLKNGEEIIVEDKTILVEGETRIIQN